MNLSVSFIRTLFILLSTIFMIAYWVGSSPEITIGTFIWGGSTGIAVGFVLITLDILFKRFTLRAFNIAILGLFFGYLMGLALTVIFNATVDIASVTIRKEVIEIIKIFLLLFGAFLGVTMTLRAADELYVSIPFIRFSLTSPHTKELILDHSALIDARIIDLASSGLLDNRLVLPRFIFKELYEAIESDDEAVRSKARRCLEVTKKLEGMGQLHLRYNDTDFPDVKDLTERTLHLARLLDADVLTADINRVQMASIEGVHVINIHALSNALKPLMQRGEYLKIKIQRYGKEERQGVGYLDDGTMVVVNGGGDYIGNNIRTRVLSVKHTSSGRMIFCNADSEDYCGLGEDEFS